MYALRIYSGRRGPLLTEEEFDFSFDSTLMIKQQVCLYVSSSAWVIALAVTNAIISILESKIAG